MAFSFAKESLNWIATDHGGPGERGYCHYLLLGGVIFILSEEDEEKRRD